MKKVTIITIGGPINFLLADEKAEHLREKLEEGITNLSSSTDSSYSWVNMMNVIQILILDFDPESEETAETVEEVTSTSSSQE